MTTLISSGNSSGEYGRCDSKCYDAKLPNCRCICGGKNHGQGFEKALEWTRRFGEDLAQRTGAEVSLPML